MHVYCFSIVNEYKPRRDPTYFETSYTRLKSVDKTLRYKGPKLCNFVANYLNKQTLNSGKNIKLERLFLDPFKKYITQYLVIIHGDGGEDWEEDNSALDLI